MSVNDSLPVSLREIQYSFGETGRVGSDDRYVRDLSQLANGETWDLLDYNGRAFGMQGEFRTDDFTASGIYGLPLTQSDKRIDGSVHSSVIGENFIETSFMDNGERKFTLNLKQSNYDSYPAALYLNGLWYMSQPGKMVDHDFSCDLSLGPKWEPGAEARVDVLGFKYGYLDGDNVSYARFGTDGSEDAGDVINWSGRFKVHEDYRHVVVAARVWQPGSYRTAESNFDIWNIEVKRS